MLAQRVSLAVTNLVKTEISITLSSFLFCANGTQLARFFSSRSKMAKKKKSRKNLR
jgi:hypothetical protein